MQQLSDRGTKEQPNGEDVSNPPLGIAIMSSYTQKFVGSAYPVNSVLEAKPPTGVDLYSRFALAGALCWYVLLSLTQLHHPRCHDARRCGQDPYPA